MGQKGLHFWILRPEISLDACFCISAVYSLVDLSFYLCYPNLGYNDVMRGSFKILFKHLIKILIADSSSAVIFLYRCKCLENPMVY